MDEENEDSMLPFSGIFGCGVVLLVFGVVMMIFGIVTAVLMVSGLSPSTEDGGSAIVETEMVDGEMALFAPSIALGGVAAGQALLSGDGMPNSIVRIFDGDSEIGQTTVGADGTWSFGANANADSVYRAVGELEDGTSVGDSSTVALAFASFTAAGFAADAGVFSLNGSGEPGLDARVRIGDMDAGTAAIDANGAWSLSADVPNLDPGDYVVSADMVDADGDVYATVADAGLLTIAAPMAGLAINGFNADGSAFASNGTGEPGSTVNLFLNGAALGSAVVAADGSWSFDGDFGDLEPGEYVVSADMVDDAGAMLADAANVSTFVIAAPELAPLTTGDLEAGDGLYTWSGTGNPGSTINIFLNGEQVGETIVADDGTWTFEGAYAGFSAGDYPLTARMLANGGGDVIDEAVDAAMLSLNAANLAAADAGDGEAAADDATGLLQVAFADGSADGAEADGSVVAAPAGLPGVALILDSSWSMTFGVDYSGIDIGPDTDESQRLTADDPNSRIAVAKGELIDFVTDTLPEGVPTVLRVFGNLRGNLECQTDLMVPLGPLDKAEMVSTLAGVSPQFNANTAIGASLDAIRTDLVEAEGTEMTIVLVTDGDETCGGDPEAAITALADAGFDVTVDIIGFAINDAALKAKLEGWAALGNGSFFDAADADALSASLVGAFAIPYTVLDADGTEVASGTIGGNTVELPVGSYTVELDTSAETTYEVEVSAEETTTVIAE